MRIIRIASDTQMAVEMPVTIYGARLVHNNTTTADIYDEAGATAGSPTATLKKIAMKTVQNYNLVDDVPLPEQGIKFAKGCYIEYNAGEVFLTVK